MAGPALSFAFARDNAVLLDGARLVYAQGATVLGLREARRRAGQAMVLEPVSVEVFAARLNQAYHQADHDTGTALIFDPDSDPAQATPRDLLDGGPDAPVIALVNQLFRRTLRDGASDLHLEPQEDGVRARIRVDGVLQTVLQRDDVPVRRVLSRIKVMAGLDTSETRLPQDGRIGLSHGGVKIDVRVSTLPGAFGERAVMRVLDRQAGLKPLDALGLQPTQEALMRRLAARPDGMILATGPTGSGKTTTLYSLLQIADRAQRNIVTVEDPIEYQLPGLNQTQTHAEIGLTFAAGLRAALRQDPDVILVGEIRDAETAHVAAQAALTGHLVYSSLHANDAVAAITRLRDLGLGDALIAATLRGVFSQRLMRRLRPNGGAGDGRYAGRLGVFELFAPDAAAAAAILAGADDQALRAQLMPEDRTMQAHASALVETGTTDEAELRRVFGLG